MRKADVLLHPEDKEEKDRLCSVDANANSKIEHLFKKNTAN